MEIIAISTDGSQVAEHFGRCPAYTIIELENNVVAKREVIANPGHRTGFLPEYLAQRGVKVVICGGMGKRAIDLFLEKGVRPIMGISGEIDEAVEQYRLGQLEGRESLCQPGRGKGYGMDKEDHGQGSEHDHSSHHCQ